MHAINTQRTIAESSYMKHRGPARLSCQAILSGCSSSAQPLNVATQSIVVLPGCLARLCGGPVGETK